MNSLERVVAALELKTPDKIPFHAYESPENAIRLLGREVHEMYLDPDVVPEAMIHAAEVYQNDIVYMRWGEYLPEGREAVADDEGLLIREKATGEVLGRVYRDQKEFLPVKAPPPDVTSLADIGKIPVLSVKEFLQQPHIPALRAYVRAFKGKRFLFGSSVAQSANLLYRHLGSENALMAALDDPGLCRAMMERGYEARKQEMLALRDLGVDGVITGDACASCSFYSPATYRDLFFAYQQRSVAFAHGLGLKVLLHICGKISGILEDMAATGADVIESLDAFSSGGDIELADAKRRVGHRVCLKGNLDAVHVLARQTPAAIYQACTQAMRDAGPGGYILSTEQITRDTPVENVLAMVQARDDFRLA